MSWTCWTTPSARSTRISVVTTTIDHGSAGRRRAALTEELAKKGGKFGVSEGAVVARPEWRDPRAGRRAHDGESQFNRAVLAKRQPGSPFKPFVDLTGLEHGMTRDTVREDGPINIKGWQPENYSREYFGPVTLTKALSLSLNTVAVRVGMEVGPKAGCDRPSPRHRFGVAAERLDGARNLGGVAAGNRLGLCALRKWRRRRAAEDHPGCGRRTASSSTPAKGSNGRVIEPEYVAMMNAMMQETLLTGTARKGELPGWQAAGKTGTSQDWRDAWFVGYTGHLVAGVWLGNDEIRRPKKPRAAICRWKSGAAI